MSDDWQHRAQAHIGRSEIRTDQLSPYFANALLASLNIVPDLKATDPLPPLFHWLYFNSPVPRHRLKQDGHEKLGDFFPAIEYPHRMWAGSSVQFHAALRLGEHSERTSTVQSINFKDGRSGPLCFLAVEHQVHQAGTLCLTDLQTIVYRNNKTRPEQKTPAYAATAQTADSSGNAASAGTANTVASTDTVDSSVTTNAVSEMQKLDAIALFQYSALTFNSHRIHYDLDYCRQIESYPDLVVHGPLMATLLIRHMIERRQGTLPTNFQFRGLSPVFAHENFRIESSSDAEKTTATLLKQDGSKAVLATAIWD